MVIRGEPDPASASIDDWMAYREHLKSLSGQDESIRVALAVAKDQIQKLQQTDVDSVARSSPVTAHSTARGVFPIRDCRKARRTGVLQS